MNNTILLIKKYFLWSISIIGFLFGLYNLIFSESLSQNILSFALILVSAYISPKIYRLFRLPISPLITGILYVFLILSLCLVLYLNFHNASIAGKTITTEIYFSTTSNLNVREGPSTTHNVLYQLNIDEEVEIIGEDEGWYEISTKKGKGYASKEFIDSKIIEEIVEKKDVDHEIFTIVGGILFLALSFYLQKKEKQKKGKSGSTSKPTTPKPIYISDVLLKNRYFQVFDNNGKKIKEAYEPSIGELCGFCSDFMIFKKNKYYATYDVNFKKIKEVYEPSVGEFKVASGSTMTFLNNKYTVTYDVNFKKINEKYTG